MLQALCKISDDKLTFQKTVEVVVEIEDATKVIAKETVYGSQASATTAPVFKMGHEKKASTEQKQTISHPHLPLTRDRVRGVVRRISLLSICRFIEATCDFCQKTGHLKTTCHQEMLSMKLVTRTPESRKLPVQFIQSEKHIPGQDPVVQQLQMNSK